MLISIAVTSYNQTSYTDTALASLLHSTGNTDSLQFRFILLDDCSTEAIGPLIEKYGKSVKFHINDRNKGVTNLWNRAYEMSADCDYLIVSNNDVIFPKGWAEILIQDARKAGAYVAGPLTNSPGPVRAQQIRRYLPRDQLRISDAQADVDANLTALRKLHLQPKVAARLNGFCLAFQYSFLKKHELSEDKPFNEEYAIYGAEIEFFRRCKPKAFVIPGCYVFHYKQVSVDRKNFKHQWFRNR